MDKKFLMELYIDLTEQVIKESNEDYPVYDLSEVIKKLKEKIKEE